MFNGKTTKFEMLYRHGSTDVIATVGDKIMVLMQEQPNRPVFPSLPGGRIEIGCTPIETAKRELLEESGYEAETMELFQEYFGSPKLYFHENVFIAKNCKKVKEQKLDGGEKIKVTFVDFDDFMQFCRNPDFTCPIRLKFFMYECLLDEKKREEFRKAIFD